MCYAIIEFKKIIKKIIIKGFIQLQMHDTIHILMHACIDPYIYKSLDSENSHENSSVRVFPDR